MLVRIKVRRCNECTERWQDENVDKEEKVGNERMIIGQERECNER